MVSCVGSLVHRAGGREGHCRQISLVCVGSAHSVLATLGLPPLTACVLSLSTPHRLQVALQGAGPELCALPRSKPLRFRFLGTPQSCRHGWDCVLFPSSSGNQEIDERTLFRCSATSPLPVKASVSARALGCALCLFWGATLWLRPSRRMSTIQNLRKSLVRNWKPVCSLVGDALSEAEFAPFWTGAHLPPASCGGWASLQPASSSLVLLSPLFCEPACSALR